MFIVHPRFIPQVSHLGVECSLLQQLYVNIFLHSPPNSQDIKPTIIYEMTGLLPRKRYTL